MEMAKAVQSKEEILKAIVENRERLVALGVRRLGLFGSFARGEPHPASDVDILVEFETGQKTFDHFMEVSFLLEDVLQRDVELVTPDSLSRHIGPHILKEAVYVSIAA